MSTEYSGPHWAAGNPDRLKETISPAPVQAPESRLSFLDRRGDYEAGLETLRPAEMSGKKTFAAQHNEREIKDVIAGFRSVRNELLRLLAGYQPETFERTALHPRLGKSMRLCDMIFFMAEHDDYHLAIIDEMIKAAS